MSPEWDAPLPRVVSAWKRESRFTYNTYSDIDRQGRFVAFVSSVRDGPGGVYLRDMRNEVITRLDSWYKSHQPVPGTPADERTYKLGSGSPSISATGRFVAFYSHSPHLVAGDENRSPDIFLYDRKGGRLQLVSTNSEGAQADGASLYPSVSATGRYIAFSSRAQNFSDDRTHRVEVYIKDMRTGKVRFASRGSRSGRLRGNAWTGSISDDGTRVAFTSDASDLVPGDTNRASDAFVADLSSGDITRVSVTSGGKELVPFEYAESASLYRDGVREVVLSGDGRVAAFATHANGLVPEDSNNNVDIYVHDLDAQRTERASVTSSGTDGYREEDRECGSNGECFSFIWSHSPTLSHDGRYISFLSGAPLLDPTGDNRTGSDEDVFVHDRQTGLTALVNRTFRGEPARGYNLYAGSISSDGRWISFATDGRLLRKRHGRGENGDVYLQRLPAPFGPSDSA